MNLKRLFRPICLIVGCTPRFRWDKKTQTGRLVCGVCGANQK